MLKSDIDAIIKTSRREVLVFVEDMLKKAPANKAKVMISDGAKVIAEGETDEEGIFLCKLKELRDAPRITAFVIKNGSVASDTIDMSGLGISQGLASRGYIYTSMPAYRPGQKVSIRGIIRDVKEGSYAVSSEAKYQVSINDSRGRMIYSEELKLSKFGTFFTEIVLDPDSVTGQYQITAQSVDEKEKIYNGTFLVEKYQLEKIKLALDFSQTIYFRGEQVEATFTASYYYGQPLKQRLIRYTLPDGRSFAEETDKDGRLKVKFDTTPMIPGRNLDFSGSIEGENVSVSGIVFLAWIGFTIEVSPSADTVISGETFDVSIQTKGADGKPISQEIVLTVYRQMEYKPHPFLDQVPWIEPHPRKTGEIKVNEHKISTDKDGKGRIKLELSEGGRYVLRASGTDRFNQPVTGENIVFISDNKDAVKLRIFAETSNLKVGESFKVRIHSRLKPSLALITFEGEGIIQYKILNLVEGWNDLNFSVDHEHFPNFHIAIAVIEDQKLYTAGRDFTVERQLIISLKLKESYPPGEEAEIQVTAIDQLGKPTESELSLALVDEALFAIYPDNIQPITDFFNQGIHRYAPMRTASSSTFRYQPITRKVIKELLEEAKRLMDEEKYEIERVEVLSQISAAAPALEMSKKEKASEAEDRAFYYADKQDARSAAFGRTLARAKLAYIGVASNAIMEGGSGSGGTIIVREEFADAGFWTPNVITDKDGSAIVKIRMPDKTTQWRLTARGCTVATLVGQNTANTITRKDFFVDIKVPNILTEGDKIRVLARIHNLTDFSGNAAVSLKIMIDGAVKASNQKTIIIEKNDTAELVFDPVDITPGREAKIEVIAKMNTLIDGISRNVNIRPWGMEYSDNKSGVSSGNEILFLQLPKELKYSSKRLDISIGPDMNRMIFDL
ncbi:hypothetical protein FJZ33_05395, partial [Candidatus Poribacteria bacterium]|nr:hypothetical protein [Candidatus Poribacteria bacterium]